MRKNILILIIVLALTLVPLTTYGEYMDINYLDIKVGSSINIAENITLSSENGFFLYEKHDVGREIFAIRNDNIIIDENNGDIDILDTYGEVLYTIPGDGSIVIGSGDYNNSIVKVSQNRYRDYITFLVKDVIEVINHIEVEHYLYGVVPKEIPAGSPFEALKAQAIVARSYAYANMDKHSKDGYNLCDTTHCQVYKAYDNEHPSTNQAIDETYGEFVTYDGAIIETLYHSNSGGMTVSSVDAWGGNKPYLISVVDEFSSNSPYSTWTVEIPTKDIEGKLLEAGIYVGEINTFEITKVTDSNRVHSLKVVGTLGEKTITGVQLQTILGLKSRWFTIDNYGGSSKTDVYAIDGSSIKPVVIDLSNAYIIDASNYTTVSRSTVNRAISSDRTGSVGSTYATSTDKFVINGRGYGHGVGMSQYGAIEMAKLGYNYEQIITHYYSGVEISNIGK